MRSRAETKTYTCVSHTTHTGTTGLLDTTALMPDKGRAAAGEPEPVLMHKIQSRTIT
jgi:hypothetical protein